jgi:hypothetical protein
VPDVLDTLRVADRLSCKSESGPGDGALERSRDSVNATVPSFRFSTFIEKPVCLRLSGVIWSSNFTARAVEDARTTRAANAAHRLMDRIAQIGFSIAIFIVIGVDLLFL